MSRRRENELFIGEQYLTIQGRAVKHPSLILYYANVNVLKTADKQIEIIALDIETEALTGEMRLLGAYDGQTYAHYTDNHLQALFNQITYCHNNNAALAYWNRLDPFVLFRLFLEKTNGNNPDKVKEALSRFGNDSGEWDKENHKWSLKPIVEIKIGDNLFGIKQVIRSSIQFYYKRSWDEDITTVWAYDIAQLYEGTLEKEAKRYEWYSKVDKSAHIVDWKRFDKDVNYRENIVLKSNMLDAMACYHLALNIQKDFKQAFHGHYPRSLVSQGALARAAIVADILKKYESKDTSTKESLKNIVDDVKSIGLMNYYDTWAMKYGKDTVKDMYCLMTEAYSGGLIEAPRYGYAKKGQHADIASAYPAAIQHLYDLRGSEIITGTGKPPKPDKSYVLIRGTVNIPKHVDYHPLTVKHVFYKDTNIRAVGTYKASYFYEEREYLEKHGSTFSDETWFEIKTTGETSVLADVCMNFINLRKRLKAENNTAQHMAKIAANSLYGILFEAVDIHEENRAGGLIKKIINESLVFENYDGYLKLADREHLETMIRDMNDDKDIEKVAYYIIDNMICVRTNERVFLESDFDFVDKVKHYIQNIDLSSIKSEIVDKHVYRRWNGGMLSSDIETVVSELSQQGIHFINETPDAIFKELNQRYIDARYNVTKKHFQIEHILEDTEPLYNILYEMIKTYFNPMADYPSAGVRRIGYRAGEFWNPLYAGYICMKTRLLMCEAATEIEKNGGKIIVMMTDSLTWEGNQDMLPKKYVKEIKTLGYFETPKEVTDIVCLGSGRYGFKIGKQYYSKRRGLNNIDITDPNGINVDAFNWGSALEKMKQTGKTEIEMTVRTLISPGMVYHRHDLGVEHLGRIVEEKRIVQAIVGKNKRLFDESLNDPALLSIQLVDTRPLYFELFMNGKDELIDQTFPILRNELMKLELKTRHEKKRETWCKNSKKKYKKHHAAIRKDYKMKYRAATDKGIEPEIAKRMANWSDERFNKYIEEMGLLNG